MRPRRLLQPLLFALALLFAQQGGILHGIGHTLTEQKQDPSQPQHQHCDLCAVYAQIGSAVGSGEFHVGLPPLPEVAHAAHAVSSRCSTFAVFAARAPPHSV